MAKSDKTVKRGVYLYIDGKEIKNDINSIDLEMKRLQRDIKEMTRGSEEYNRTMAKIQHLQGILKQHRQEIKGITTETKKATVSIGSMVDWFNRFGGVILSVIGFLTGFTIALRAIRDERNKLEESQAGLKALTGLDDDSIAWLTGQAKTLSTTMTKEGLRVRQSAAEILDAFMLVGSAKPELLGDKEALKAVTEEAMRLQAAAKDITLNEAVDSLTLSLNQYGAAADQAGRFVNVLAAGSKEGAVNIASQAKAIQKSGTIAASSNIPIEELVGTIEMLGEKGVKDEIAGTGLKTFFTRLATGATDTNPKVVGLTTALDNLNKKVAAAEAQKVGGGTTLLKKLFGDEGMQTAMILSQNTEQVKKYIAAVTDTNIAYEQAAINSDTAAAKLAQARNKMKLAAIDLGEKLNPALAVSTNMLTNVLKYLPGLIDWCQKWGGTITIILVPVAAYVGYLKAISIYHRAYNAVLVIGKSVQLAYAAAIATVNGQSMLAVRNINAMTVALQGHNLTLRILKGTMYLSIAAMSLFTGNIHRARSAMKAFNAICSKNVYVAVAAGITAIAIAMYKVATRTTEVEKATKDYQKRLYMERTELQKLFDATQHAGDGTRRRKELIDEINLKYGKYLTNLLDEHSSLEDIKRAYQDINTAMQANIAQKVLNEKTEEISRDMLDKKIDRMNKVRSTLSNLFPSNLANDITQRIDKTVNMAVEKGETAQQVSMTLAQKIRQLYGGNKDFEDNLRKGITAYADTVIKESKRISKVKDELAVFVPGVGQTNELPEVVITGNASRKQEDGGTPIAGSPDKDRFVKVEAEYYRRIADIKRKYLDDDKMSQKEYDRQMRDAEIQLLNDKLKVKGLEPSEIQRINDQILDAEIKARDELRKFDEQSARDAEKRRKKQGEETYSRLEKEYQLQIEAATMYHYENKTSEEEYLNELHRLQNVYHNKVLEDVTVSEEDKQKVRKLADEAQMADAKKKYESEVEAFTKMKDTMIDVSKQLGESLAEFFTSEEKDFGEFMKNVLVIMLDTLEKQLIATQAAAIAEVTIKDISTKGLLGLASAAAKIALITAAFETAKGILGNFYIGGYTGPGDWDQPQGIVHSNEFVANRFAVANPNLRPIFDAIDVAQRSGNVGNLTAEDIAAVAGSGKSTRTVPAKAPAASATTTTNDPAMVAMLIECTRVLRKLKNRLDDPLVAETYVTGKRGINQAQKEYEKMRNHITRKK